MVKKDATATYKVLNFSAPTSIMETNMDIMNPFNTLFVMDDPTTPLCIPVCNSFDQEFQLQENIHLNMLPQNITLKSSGTAEATNALPHQSPDEQIELPLDLFDYLENVPFNIEELIEEENYDTVILSDGGNYQTNRRRNPNPDIQMSEELLSTPTVELVQLDDPLQIKNEDDTNLEEMCSFSLNSTYQIEENFQIDPLHLNLTSILQPVSAPSEGVVTTPVLINMLLEKEEIRKQKPVEQVMDMKPILDSVLPQVLQDFSSDSATESSLPPTPITRTRTNTKRSRNSTSNNSDIRRVRNNEASRKSRQNRRKKLQTQAQLVDVLEEENRCLNSRIKELETLKAEIMKYMTGTNKTTTLP